MEFSTPLTFDYLSKLHLTSKLYDIGIMNEENRHEDSLKESVSGASSSSICFDEKQETPTTLYELVENSILDRPLHPQEQVTFIPMEESLSDCPTYFHSMNQRRKKYSSHSTNTEFFHSKGELYGHQSRSVKRKISCENLYQPFLEDLSVTLTTTVSKIEIPIKRMISQLEMNSPEEIQLIEENIRINDILAEVNVVMSQTSISDDDDDDRKLCNKSECDGSSHCFYTRITSQYPLMTCPFKRSNESLVAVLDFDVNDDLGNTSGYQNCYH